MMIESLVNHFHACFQLHLAISMHRGLLGALDLMIAQATKQKMLVTYFCAFG